MKKLHKTSLYARGHVRYLTYCVTLSALESKLKLCYRISSKRLRNDIFPLNNFHEIEIAINSVIWSDLRFNDIARVQLPLNLRLFVYLFRLDLL